LALFFFVYLCLPLSFRYYRAVYERNIAFLQGNAEKKTQANLMNVAMELRKVCNVSCPTAASASQACSCVLACAWGSAPHSLRV
jgi:hypothetical protein